MAGVYKIDKERRQNLRPFRWGAGAFSFFYRAFLLGKNRSFHRARWLRTGGEGIA